MRGMGTGMLALVETEMGVDEQKCEVWMSFGRRIMEMVGQGMMDGVKHEKDAFGGAGKDEGGQEGSKAWMNRPKKAINLREASRWLH